MNHGKFQKQTKSKKKLHVVLSLIIGISVLMGSAFFLFEAGRKVGENSQLASTEDISSLQNIVVDTIAKEPVETETTAATELTEPKTAATVTNPAEAIIETASTAPTIETTALPEKKGTVLRSAGALNIRSGPGTNYEIAGRLNGGDSVTIYEEQMQDGMYWGNIGYGWVCMDYIVFGIDNSSPPNVSLDDVFYDIEPLLGVSRADYIGYWVGGSQNTWSLEITKTGNSVYISVERMDNSTDKTVWGMTGTFDNQAILCYSSGVCTSFVNGYSTLRYTTGEGTFVLRDGQMSWYERMEGNITFMTFTRAGAHTTAPSEQGNNQYTQPSQANGNQTTQNIPQRFHSDDLRKALEREVKIQLGYRNGDSFEIGYPWLLKYDSSTGKYYAAANGKWCGSNFYINAVLMDVNGVLTVSTVIECHVK